MGTKEKLVELLKRTEYQFTVTHSLTVENVATDLIQQGVTVQEWISVEDRLPEEGEHILVCYIDGWICDQHAPIDNGITHWMPLPEPPKGE